MKLNITFLEPFRMAYWKPDRQRSNTNKKYMRGRSFAQWHRCSKGGGNLYISGYLLRSHVIRAAETLLTLTGGLIDLKGEKIGCCPGYFKTDKNIRNEKFQIRRRNTLKWNTPGECCTDKDPCPLCVILGPGSRKKKRTKKDDRPIHFNILTLPGDPLFSDIRDIADERIVNRVDYTTGKAHDFYKIYEIDHKQYPCVEGSIELKSDVKNMAAEQLLTDSLRFVDRLCGALCVIDIQKEQTDADLTGCENETVKKIAVASGDDDTIVKITEIVKSKNPDKLGVLSKAFGELGTDRCKVGQLVCDHDGKKEHYLWDMKKEGEKKSPSIRDLIEKKKKEVEDHTWKDFCDRAADHLHKEFKQAFYRGFSQSTRILGKRSFQGIPEPDTSFHQVTPSDMTETLIYGKLVSETPFFFGLESENSHPDLKVLTDRENRFRLPRSVLRGILRRDLRTAIGTGCDMPLGKRACNCDVCLIMKNITVLDARSDERIPVETRTRIRINPFTGTVAEGALFDMELGPKGTAFPFVLRYREKGGLPAPLQTVLHWWTQGRAFLGGAVATGKSRFRLTNPDESDSLLMKTFKLSDDKTREAYLKNCGWRGHEAEKISEYETFTPKKSKDSDFPWQKIEISIDLDSPFLNGDPVRALLENDVEKQGPDGKIGADIVSFMTYTDAGKSRVYAYKGESLRGVVRTAVGRIAEDAEDLMKGKDKKYPPLIISHNDCDCVICRIFGSEYETGKLRFEDLTFTAQPRPFLFDHVAIDRFTGGAVDKKKFDDVSLIAPDDPNASFTLSGCIWVREDIKDEDIETLKHGLADIKNGMYPLGGKAGIGYGHVKDLRIEGSGEIAEELQGYLKDVSLNTKAKTEIPEKEIFDGSDILKAVTPDKVFYPHYFLKPHSDVKRDEKIPVSHHTLHEELLTGFIECSLDTLSPLIIPDTFNDDFFGLADKEKRKKGEKYHKSYDFLTLNGKPVIPGSALRGMVSTVFEALTNSCFRIFDEKYRLSWRMSADVKVLEEFKPGRIISDPSSNGKRNFLMEEMTEVRYPFYDMTRTDKKSQDQLFQWNSFYRVTDESLEKMKAVGIPGNLVNKLRKLSGRKYKNEKMFELAIRKEISRRNADAFKSDIFRLTRQKGDVAFYDHPTPTDQRLLSLAGPNRRLAKIDASAKYKILKHRPGATEKDAFMFVATPSENTEGFGRNHVHQDNAEGYLKISGPNKIEKKNENDSQLPPVPEHWGSFVHNSVSLAPVSVMGGKDRDKECTRNRLVPGYVCSDQNKKEGVTYNMTKRCERVFLKTDLSPIAVMEKAVQKFETLVQEYRKNAEQQETPEPFQTILPENGTINHGDLVYFKKENGKVIEIIPVKISREVDDKYLAEHFDQNLRPCHGEWIREEDLNPLNPYPEKKLLTRHKDGLCPACRTFGTGAYKGRVRFDFAGLNGEPEPEPKWQNKGEGITLPLLERPRPTWSVPDKKARIPGRKFYIHHNGWKQICEERTQPGKIVKSDKDKIEPNKNNKTVKALAPKNAFTFRVHFENLRDYELGLLLWSLQLEQGLAHKLGMGKSFGFGSVNIQVKNINCIRFEKNDKNHDNTCFRKKEWENRNDEIKGWIQAGRDKISEWFGKEQDETDRMNALRQLLFYFEDKSKAPKVYYPPLEKDEKTKGYKELKKTLRDNDNKELKRLLNTPWHPWNI